MSCPHCREPWFWKKIGTCHRCMWQLTFLTAIGWPIWFYFFSNQASQVAAIAALFANLAFTGLLTLHLVFKFLVLPFRGKG